MKFDLSHWPKLPKVSCQCITYGRTDLLDEAVECFLRQDYPGEKELVILNDYDQLWLQGDIPNVKIINALYRMRTIGAKRNACVSLTTGDIIFPWDDDDISLPWRISYSLSRMTNLEYYKADRAWLWKNGEIAPEPKKHVMHAMGAWSVKFFDEVGGYPRIDSGQDQAIEARFREAEGSRRVVAEPALDEIYYIYRFPGTGSYHLSAAGWDKGMKEAERYVTQKAISGIHEVTPHWNQDYIQLAATAVEEMRDVVTVI